MGILNINSDGNLVEISEANAVKALAFDVNSNIVETEISGGGEVEWTPPADWIDISNVANNEIHLLVGDFTPSVSFNILVSGGYTVNWGDGVTQNYANGDDATHTFTVGGGQACSRGYTTYKIRIYAQTPANNITRFIINAATIQQQYNGLLWAKFGTQGLTSLAYAFYDEGSASSSYLECIELPESLTSCTSFYYFVAYCWSLQKVKMPLNYSSSNINFQNAFYGCGKLPKVDYRANTLNVSNFSYAHSGNTLLKSLILPTTVNNCTTWGHFLDGCKSIVEFIAPTINTNCTCSAMLLNMTNLYKSDLSSFNNRITDANNLYSNNTNQEVLISPTNMPINGSTGIEYMYYNCNKIKEITMPNFTGVAITSVANLLNNNYNLETVNNFPSLNSVTTVGNFIAYCHRLKYIDNLDQLGNTTSSVEWSGPLTGCYSLESLSVRMLLTKFTLAGTASGRAKLNSLRLLNQSSTFSGGSPQVKIDYTELTQTALETVFGDFPSGLASKTWNITGVLGNAGLVSKASSGTTSGSTTITQSNTSSLAIGMEVYGTGITDVRVVTFQGTPDTVTRTAHGIPNGQKVSFSVITTTKGIVINKPYYVINATADTFQLSLTEGGSAIALTNDGSGSLRVYPKITAITGNTNITIDIPCTATGSVTMTSSVLARSILLLKGATITG